MRNFLTILILLTPIIVFSQDFKTVPAKSALEKYKAEIKRSEEIKIAAEEQYKKELSVALKSAMQNMNLDEANLIKKSIDDCGNAKTDNAVKDSKPQIKGEKNDKIEAIPLDSKKEKVVELKLTDAHNSIVGCPVPYKPVFSLCLKKSKNKTISLTLIGDAAARSVNALEVFVNGESVGNWEYKNEDPSATCIPMSKKTHEVDITKCIKDEEIKQYDITFKRICGFDNLNVSEVKATYK